MAVSPHWWPFLYLWTAVATLLPLIMGLVVTFVVAQVWRLLAGTG